MELSDRLADKVRKWAMGIATAEGGVTGFFGIVGVPFDVPAVTTLSLRTITKIGLCYGYETLSEKDRKFVLGILAAASV